MVSRRDGRTECVRLPYSQDAATARETSRGPERGKAMGYREFDAACAASQSVGSERCVLQVLARRMDEAGVAWPGWRFALALVAGFGLLRIEPESAVDVVAAAFLKKFADPPQVDPHAGFDALPTMINWRFP